MNVVPLIQSVTNLVLLFELLAGSSRVSVSDSSRPVIKVASLDHELVLRRHAVGLRSQHGNMDETIVGNGKSFIIQYSPKIMHTQEVAQEVLAPQEHASRRKK